MLASITEYPQAGSRGYLKPDATPVRILQHTRDGRVQIAVDEPNKRASSTRTVDAADLAPSIEEADAALIARAARRSANKPATPKRTRRSAR